MKNKTLAKRVIFIDSVGQIDFVSDNDCFDRVKFSSRCCKTRSSYEDKQRRALSRSKVQM